MEWSVLKANALWVVKDCRNDHENVYERFVFMFI